MAGQALDRRLPLALRVNFAWSFAGKMAYAASRAAILMLIAKLGTAEMVGQYALAFAVTTPIFMCADMDLRSVLATDTKNRLAFADYLGLRLLTTAACMAVVGAMALLQGNPQTALVLLLVGAARGSDAVSDMLYGLMQKHERMDRPGVSLMLKSALSTLAMGLLLALRHSLVWGVAGMALAWLVVLLCYDIPSARPFASVRIRLRPRELRSLLKLSLPLGAVLLFSSLNRNLPNYFINAFQGTAALGYFSSIVYILTSGSLVDTALSQSANARMARLFGSGDTRGFVKVYLKIAGLTLALGACMLGAAAAFGGPVLSLLYRPEYAAYAGVFTLVMAAAGMSYAADITMSTLTSARNFLIQPLLCGGTLAVGLLLNARLVPGMGLAGAALCILLTACLQLAGSAAALARTVRKRNAGARFETTVKEGFEVERIASPEALPEGLAQRWKELLDGSESDVAFADPDWLAAWWRVYGCGLEPLLLTVLRQGEPVAFIPLTVDRRRGVKLVRFMGCPQATHMDVACRADCLDGAAAALLGYLRGMKGLALISLTGLKENSAFLGALAKRLKKERIPRISGSTPCFVIHTAGRDFVALYHGRFPGVSRKKDRQKDTRLAAIGRVSFRYLSPYDMAGAFSLHARRWMRKIDTSGFSSGQSAEFYPALLQARASRWKAMAVGLFLDERLVAFEYGFLCGGRALFYRSAHDDLFGVYSPGKMIKREYTRRCIGMGARTIDHGVGFEEYKAQWTDEREYLCNLSFPNAGVLPLAPFLLLCLKEKARGLLKRSRGIVLFRRNTLGRLRYLLSPGHMPEALRRRVETARRRGVYHLLPRSANRKRQVELRFDGSLPDNLGTLRTAERASPRDAEDLAMLMDCAPEEVMKGFFRLQRCHVLRAGGAIACAAWAAEDGDRAVISGLCADRRLCRADDAAALLGEILADFKKPHAETVLRLDGRSAMLLNAARLAGFAGQSRGTAPASATPGTEDA